MRGNLSVDVLTMVVIIGERIVDRGKTNLRIIRQKFFWTDSVMQHIHDDRPNGNPRSREARASPTDKRIADDVRVKNFRHS